jgi:hypothetical protein
LRSFSALWTSSTPIAHLLLVGKLYAPWTFGPWIWGAMHLVDNLSIVARQVSAAQAASTAAQQAYLAGPVTYSLLGVPLFDARYSSLTLRLELLRAHLA